VPDWSNADLAFAFEDGAFAVEIGENENHHGGKDNPDDLDDFHVDFLLSNVERRIPSSFVLGLASIRALRGWCRHQSAM
jgi:hypothetical protein